MKGFRVFRAEGQQLGAGECRHVGHATKLHSFKSHTTHEHRRLGGAHSCDSWQF